MKKINEKPVLYIIDSPSECRALKNQLHARGYAVRTFDSARDFLDSDFQRTSACLIIDLEAAGVSASELKKALRERKTALPIIVMTLEEDLSALGAVRDLGATAYFRKPIDERALIDAIEWSLIDGN